MCTAERIQNAVVPELGKKTPNSLPSGRIQEFAQGGPVPPLPFFPLFPLSSPRPLPFPPFTLEVGSPSNELGDLGKR